MRLRFCRKLPRYISLASDMKYQVRLSVYVEGFRYCKAASCSCFCFCSRFPTGNSNKIYEELRPNVFLCAYREDRRCMCSYYSGTFTEPLFQWKSNKYFIFRLCVCSHIYPAWKAHAPYYVVIYVPSGCTTFFHITALTVKLSWKITEHRNVCFEVLYAYFARNTSHCKKNSARYYHKCTYRIFSNLIRTLTTVSEG